MLKDTELGRTFSGSDGKINRKDTLQPKVFTGDANQVVPQTDQSHQSM